MLSFRLALRRSRPARKVGGLIVAAFAILALALAACGGGSGATAAQGRTLAIEVTKPEIVERVSYTSDGQHFVITPKASNRQLALVNIRVVNQSSTLVPLAIGVSAAQLGDRRGERIDAQDPFEAAKPTDTPPEEGEKSYIPFLWGEIVLEKRTQVGGWMIFDVPKGLRLSTIWWNEVDGIIVDVIKPKRPG